MTPRELFLKIANHLLTQNEKAMDRENCRYRILINEDTFGASTANVGKILRCAAGCLIPDQDYKPEFEGNAIGHFGTEDSVTKYFTNKYSDEQLTVIRKLQLIHDGYNVSNWKNLIKTEYFTLFGEQYPDL